MRVLRIIDPLNVGSPANHVAWLEPGVRERAIASKLVTDVVAEGESDVGYFAAEHLGDDHLLLRIVGRLCDIKNHEMLLHAFARLGDTQGSCDRHSRANWQLRRTQPPATNLDPDRKFVLCWFR